MKKKILDEKPVTKGEMDEAFERFRFSFKVEMRGEIEELLTQFRSDMFTRLDQIVGELAQIREEQLFINHDNRTLKGTDEDHEVRIEKLEKRINN